MSVPVREETPPPQRYVLDNNGLVWLLCPEYDYAMVTRADTVAQYSAGIEGLRREAGPLIEFDSYTLRVLLGGKQ